MLFYMLKLNELTSNIIVYKRLRNARSNILLRLYVFICSLIYGKRFKVAESIVFMTELYRRA